MDVEHPPEVAPDKLRRENAHEAGERDRIRAAGVDACRQLALEQLEWRAARAQHRCGVGAQLARAGQSWRIGAVGNDQRDAGIDLALQDRRA